MNSDLEEPNSKVNTFRKEPDHQKSDCFRQGSKEMKLQKNKKMKLELDCSRESLSFLFVDCDFQLTSSGKGCTSKPCKSPATGPSVTAVAVLHKDVSDFSAGNGYTCTYTPCKSSAPGPEVIKLLPCST